MKVIVGVLANDETGYNDMVKACRETCYSTTPKNVKVFYLYNHRRGYEVKSPYYVNGDCFYNDCFESRSTILDKTLAFFDYCLRNEDFDFLVRPNCGSYLNMPELLKHIEGLPETGVYSGVTSTDTSLPIYNSGSCFVLSKDVVRLLVDNKEKIRMSGTPGFVMDDVSIGECLSLLGILPGKQILRHDATFEELKNFDYADMKHQYYFRHSIDPRCFRLVHEKIGLK